MQNATLTALRLGIHGAWYGFRFVARAYSKLLDADTLLGSRDLLLRKYKRLVRLGAMLAPASLAGDTTFPAAFSTLLTANGKSTFRNRPVTVAVPRGRTGMANQMCEDKIPKERTRRTDSSRRGLVHRRDLIILYAEKLSVS
jgi:hypothetical protein